MLKSDDEAMVQRVMEKFRKRLAERREREKNMSLMDIQQGMTGAVEQVQQPSPTQVRGEGTPLPVTYTHYLRYRERFAVDPEIDLFELILTDALSYRGVTREALKMTKPFHCPVHNVIHAGYCEHHPESACWPNPQPLEVICKVRAAGKTDPPQDCSCDERATKVIETMQECGWGKLPASQDEVRRLIAKLSDLAVELEKHSNDHIRDESEIKSTAAAVEGVVADRINYILKPYRVLAASPNVSGSKT